jgi:hypothetical protein
MKNNQMIEKLRKYMPFIITCAIFAIYHLFINTNSNDDAWFREHYTQSPLIDFVIERYRTWTSRTLIDIVMYVTNRYTVFWKIVDTALMASILVMLCYLTNAKDGEKWLCCFFTLIYPFYDMSSAGWIATTMNYTWPVGSALYVCVILKKMINNKELKWYEYIISFLVLLFACDQEQIAAFMLVVLGYALFLQIRQGSYRSIYLYIMLAISVLSLIYAITCPGNESRYKTEAAAYAPEHLELTSIEKLFAGLLNTFGVFVAKPNTVFAAVMIILVLMVYLKTNSVIKTMISSLPLMIIFSHTILPRSLLQYGIIFSVPENTFDTDILGRHNLFFIAELAVVIFGVLFAVYQLINDQFWEEFMYQLVILGAGFAVAVVVGFSASMYVSGDRIFICFYFTLIYVCIRCVCKNRDVIVFPRDIRIIGRVIAALWVLVNISYNLYFSIVHK